MVIKLAHKFTKLWIYFYSMYVFSAYNLIWTLAWQCGPIQLMKGSPLKSFTQQNTHNLCYIRWVAQAEMRWIWFVGSNSLLMAPNSPKRLTWLKKAMHLMFQYNFWFNTFDSTIPMAISWICILGLFWSVAHRCKNLKSL